MKRLLKGFTLAEVLITLTIIGVVARVTLPALMTNVSSQSTATSLSKAINTLSVGNERILSDTGSNSLSGAANVSTISAAKYAELLENYSNGYLRSNVTLDIDGSSSSGLTTFTTKDGIMFTSVPSEVVSKLSTLNSQGDRTPGKLQPIRGDRVTPPKYSGTSFWLLIDINGTGAPNRLAKDQFIVCIDNFGQVIPYGGAEYSRYALSGEQTIIPVKGSSPITNKFTDPPEWETRCASGITPSSVTAKAACTGSIVDNGYKVIYAY